jgi:3-hydroxyisobutyrate dehydrogenase-like beta-hydroxyacid dehydrogenase
MRDRAEAGTLAVMAGGDEEAFRKVQPLLRMIGERVTYVGGPGNGQLTKMINNVLFNISCAAMAEALPMAVRLGLDAEQVCAAVSAGSGQSFGFDFFSRLALRRDFTPGYPMAAAYKDMAVLAEMADRHGIPAPVASAARQTYERALRMGLGGENKGAMIKVWEEALGLEVKQKEAR